MLMNESIVNNNKKRVQNTVTRFVNALFFKRDFEEASKLISKDIRFVSLDGSYIDSSKGNFFESNKDIFSIIPRYISHGLIMCNVNDITDLLYECTASLTDLESDSEIVLDNIRLSIVVRINAEDEVLIIKVSHSPLFTEDFIKNQSNVVLSNEDKYNKTILKKVIDSYPYPIFWKDKKGRFQGSNRALLERHHFPNEKYIEDKDDYELFPDTNFNKMLFSESDKAVIKNGRTITGYYKEENASNSGRYIQYIKTPIYDDEKMIGVVGFTSDITQLKELENKYKNIQKQLDYVLNNTNIGYFLKDTESRYIKVNQSFADFAGYDKDYLLGKTEEEIDLPFETPPLLNRESDVLKNKKTISFKSIISNVNGIERTISVTEGPILYNNSEEVSGTFGLIEDISELQNQHKLLQDQYNKAIDYLKTDNFISYWRVDLDEKMILELNTTEGNDLTRIPYSGKLIENIINSVMYEDKRAIFRQLYSVENLIKNFNPNNEFTFDYFGNSIAYDRHYNFSVRTKFIRNPINNHREVIHYSFDQSEAVKKEELYNSLAKKQYDFIAKFYVPFNLAILLSDNSLDYNFKDITKNKECNMNDFLEKIFENYIIEDRDSSDFIELFKKDLKNKDSVFYSFHTKNHKRKTITLDVTDRSKNIFYIFGSDITDITEKDNRVKKELELAANKAEKANEIKSEFLARMSHDMRTPLNGIIGMADFGEDENNIDVLKDYLSKISFSGKYLLTLVNDVLDMQSISKGKLKLNYVPCAIKGSMKHLLQLVKQRAVEKNITIELNIKDIDETYALIDTMRMRQAIVNILSNSIKYTQNCGTVKFSGTITPIRKDLATIKIVIADNGVGMSKEFQKHMYESFTSENNNLSSQEGGTGLGLSITSSLIKLMGGTIECESELSVGSTFTLTFPIKIISKEKYDELLVHKDFINLENKIEGKEILVCEDNSINRMVIEKILCDEGAKVVFANDGLDGVFKSKNDNFDIILMDIRMPIMDGLEAANEIRKFNTKVPIIALSANAYNEDVEKSFKNGMNAHLAKPIDRDKLIYTINKFL
jgi:PAS domain S-box-containing protein